MYILLVINREVVLKEGRITLAITSSLPKLCSKRVDRAILECNNILIGVSRLAGATSAHLISSRCSLF